VHISAEGLKGMNAKLLGRGQDGPVSWLSTSRCNQLFSSPEFALNPDLTKLKIQPVNFPFPSVIASDNCEYHWPNFEVERLEALHSMGKARITPHPVHRMNHLPYGTM
jgi:hypothetical protein